MPERGEDDASPPRPLGDAPAGSTAGDGGDAPAGPEAFKAVLQGRAPDGSGRRLGRLDKDGNRIHRPGRDLTFSAPKSVSLIALVGGDSRVVGAHDRAVARTLAWIETNAAETRMRDPETGRMVRAANQSTVAATFRHDTSRNLAPQLHTHAVLANMVRGKDGRWPGSITRPARSCWKAAKEAWCAGSRGRSADGGAAVRSTAWRGSSSVPPRPLDLQRHRPRARQQPHRRGNRGEQRPCIVPAQRWARMLSLSEGDPQLRHLNHAWASTVQAFQGRTVANVIAAMEANHPHLTTQKSFYVEISRARNRAELLTDDAARLHEQLKAVTGERILVVEGTGEGVRGVPAKDAEAGVWREGALARDSEADRGDTAQSPRASSGMRTRRRRTASPLDRCMVNGSRGTLGSKAQARARAPKSVDRELRLQCGLHYGAMTRPPRSRLRE